MFAILRPNHHESILIWPLDGVVWGGGVGGVGLYEARAHAKV